MSSAPHAGSNLCLREHVSVVVRPKRTEFAVSRHPLKMALKPWTLTIKWIQLASTATACQTSDTATVSGTTTVTSRASDSET